MNINPLAHRYHARVAILLAATLFAAAAARAEVTVDHNEISRPPELHVFDTSHSHKLLEFKPYVGIGFASIMQNFGRAIPDLADNQMTADVMIRPGIDVSFFINNGVAIGTGLAVSDKRLKYAMSIVSSDPETISSLYTRCHFYEIYIPVYVSIRCNLSRRLKWHMDLGAYLVHGLDGKQNVSGYTTGQNSLGQPVISHSYYSRDYFDDKSPVLSTIQRFDYGPRLTSGLIINRHYSIAATLDLGIRNLALLNALSLQYRNISFILEAGYRF